MHAKENLQRKVCAESGLRRGECGAGESRLSSHFTPIVKIDPYAWVVYIDLYMYFHISA